MLVFVFIFVVVIVATMTFIVVGIIMAAIAGAVIIPTLITVVIAAVVIYICVVSGTCRITHSTSAGLTLLDADNFLRGQRGVNSYFALQMVDR